ncbi:MAG: RNA polymerase sigma factor [Isosphaeraceae bacterium]
MDDAPLFEADAGETLIDRLHQRAINGDVGALTELIEICAEPLWVSILRRVGNVDVAEDIRQETWIKVFLNLHRSVGRPFLAWLRSIAIHATIDFLRKEGRRTYVMLPDEMTEPASEEDRLEVLYWISRELGIKLELDREDWLLRLRSAYLRLPPEEQELLRLKYVEGLTQEEIAQRLGVTVGSVNMKLYRARNRLRDFIKEGGHPPPPSPCL